MADWMRNALDAGAARVIAERDAIRDEIGRRGTVWAADEIQTLRRGLAAAREALTEIVAATQSSVPDADAADRASQIAGAAHRKLEADHG